MYDVPNQKEIVAATKRKGVVTIAMDKMDWWIQFK